ncbi:MAG: DNA cytosine methyltransferase, partial [Candidatus Adiutrix sp.]|nr:DNA cytosine methyltransferase [Candidatus Adiutrix sp.]
MECEALVTQALTARLGDGGPNDNKAQGGFYIPSVQVFGGNKTSGSIRVSPALNAHGGGSRRMDFESEAFVANTLRGEGFDGSEDGTGRANLIPVPINLQLATRHEALGDRTAFGIGPEGGPAFTLTKTHSHGV